jgi:glucokinase
MSDRIAVGIDLGGTKILSLVATERGDVLGEDLCATDAADGGPSAVVARIDASVRRALDQAGLTVNDVEGAGISSPGPCDPAKGMVTDAPNLPGFHNIPLARLVSDALGVPTMLENDANAAAYGEFRLGAGQGVRHLLYVTLGTGVGGGIIIDGKVYWGASGAAGEVGHLVVDEHGPPCNCGGHGCVEALASGPAIARAAREEVRAGRSPIMAELTGEGRITAEIVHEAAIRGDAVAREVIERAGHYLGRGLIGLLNVFNPEALILGGGLVNLGDLYLEPALRTAREGAFDQAVADVTISIAKLGGRAGALGAAAIMLDHEPR